MPKFPAWAWVFAGAALILAAGWWWWPSRGMELPADNLLANASFESGEKDWTYPAESEAWKGFAVDRKEAHSGRKAAHLSLVNDPQRATAVWGVMQELHPRQFPRYLAGFRRVNAWEKNTPLMYLQAVVIVWFKRPLAGMNNLQVRFLLGGVSFRPTRMENVRYIHFSKEQPVPGEWAPFAVDIWEAFKSQWGWVPPEWEKVNVFFEARYDDREKPDARLRGEVFYDDLYLGQSLPEFARGVVK